ncbi:MAG: ferritin-like domain-containing protein [Bryobacteraceae bacterium]
MKIESLEELFVEELKDLYHAEKQLVKALPKMVKAATSDELRTAFADHLEQTKTHVQRLEQVFESMDEKAKTKTCKGMQGLIEEGQETMSEDAIESMADLGLIAAAQKVEHYEISGYGTMRTFAGILGNQEAVRLLSETLKEEEAADKLLTRISESLLQESGTMSREEEEEEEEIEA